MNQSAIRAFGIAIFLVGALLALADRFDLNIGLPTVTSSTKQDVKELQTKLHQADEEIASLKEQLKKHSQLKHLLQIRLGKLTSQLLRRQP